MLLHGAVASHTLSRALARSHIVSLFRAELLTFVVCERGISVPGSVLWCVCMRALRCRSHFLPLSSRSVLRGVRLARCSRRMWWLVEGVSSAVLNSTLQGDAGTGKSYLTRAMISALQNKLVHKHSGAVGKVRRRMCSRGPISATCEGPLTWEWRGNMGGLWFRAVVWVVPVSGLALPRCITTGFTCSCRACVSHLNLGIVRSCCDGTDGDRSGRDRRHHAAQLGGDWVGH